MEVSYKFTPKEIKKLSKFKNPSIILKKENIVKNGKYKIHLTKNMFNKLLEEKQLKYVFTDKRKENYIKEGGSLASIFKSLSPHLIKFGKKAFASSWNNYGKYINESWYFKSIKQEKRWIYFKN